MPNPFKTLVVACCSLAIFWQAQAQECCPYIVNVQVLPASPAPNVPVQVATEVATPALGSFLQHSMTFRNDTFFLQACYYSGAAAQPQLFRDTFQLGILQPGEYTLVFQADMSEIFTSCQGGQSKIHTQTFQVPPGQIVEMPITFQKAMGGGGNDFGWDVIEAENGYVVAGEFIQSPGNPNAILFRTGPQGHIGWQKTFGNSGEDRFQSVCRANDGGFVAWGAMTDPVTNFILAFLVKVNDTGQLQWQKTVTDGQLDALPQGRIIRVPDGYLISSKYFQYNPLSTASVLTRINNNGDVVWGRQLSHELFDIGIDYSIHLASDSALYACGSSSHAAPGLMKINPANGHLMYFRQYLYQHPARLTGVCPTVDGNLMLCGVVTTDTGSAHQPNRALLTKVTPDGQQVWTKTYQVGNWIKHRPSITTEYGAFYLSIENDAAQNVLLKMDQNGQVLWTKNFGGSQEHQFFPPKATSDGGLIFTGSTRSDGFGNADILLVKTDKNGIIESCGTEDRTIQVADWTCTVKTGSISNVPFSYQYASDANSVGSGSVVEKYFCEDPLKTWYPDADHDGYGNTPLGIFAATQPLGYVQPFGDCNDNNPSIYPGAPENDNGLDDDCDGLVDEGLVAAPEPGDNSFRLYPNPAWTAITLEWAAMATNGMVYSITDVAGLTLQTGALTIAGQRTTSIDISGLPAGCYTLRITQSDGMTRLLRFIKT